MRSRRHTLALAAGAALWLLARPAFAYIDPGTGGAVFGSVAAMVGIMAIAAAATFGFARHYFRGIAAFIWRHRLIAGALLLGLAIGAAAFIIGAGARSVQDAGPHAPHDAEPQRRRLIQGYMAAQDSEIQNADPFRLFAERQPQHVRRGRYAIGGRSRNCFIIERSVLIEKALRPSVGQRLVFHVGAAHPQHKWSGTVRVRVSLDGPDGEDEVFAETWRKVGEGQHWRPVNAELSPYGGADVTLRIDVTMDDTREGQFCLVSEPLLVGSDSAGRPNVIVWSLETARRDHLSVYGYPRPTTPFLEELAREAVVFEDAYSQSCWTRPSIASLLTGLYPAQHGAHLPLHRLGDSVLTLPECLRPEGYITAAFCTNPLIANPGFNYQQGFDLFVHEKSNPASVLVSDLVEWLDSGPRQPFFIFAHTIDPHAPYEAPEGYADVFTGDYEGPLRELDRLDEEALKGRDDLTEADLAYAVARYDAELLYSDVMLARLVNALRARDLWDSTMLVVTSDHGEELGEHGYWGHKRDLMVEKLRVPLIVKLPGGRYGGERLAGPASGVDIMPTVLAALGLATPQQTAGVDLLSAVETGRTPREHHFAEFRPDLLLATGAAHYSVISERYQYIRRTNTGPGPDAEHLFDLAQDPAAQNDLARQMPRQRDAMAALLWERYGEPGYTLAANGSGTEVRYTGRLRARERILGVRGVRTEADDSFVVSDDRTELRFSLGVDRDDDVLRVRTEPANAPVELELERPQDADIYVGAGMDLAAAKPVSVPAERCAADVEMGVTPSYEIGRQGGLFLWRQGVPLVGEVEGVEPDEETLEALKDLGYM